MLIVTGVNLKSATRQDVFDFIVFQLLKQGRPARIGPAGACRYRVSESAFPATGSESLRCGIGMIISDADYTPALESKTIDIALTVRKFNLPLGAPQRDQHDEYVLADILHWLYDGQDHDESLLRQDLLQQIQAAHDSANDSFSGPSWIDEFKRGAKTVAENQRLDSSILNFEPSQDGAQ